MKIANALNVEVYQLFIPENENSIFIEETPKNEKIRVQIQNDVIANVRRAVDSALKNLKG